MISDVYTSKYGRLKLEAEDEEGRNFIIQSLSPDREWDYQRMGDPSEARVVFSFGKNQEGWWEGKDFLLSIQKALLIFERRYPDYHGLWIFDNSTGHSSK